MVIVCILICLASVLFGGLALFAGFLGLITGGEEWRRPMKVFGVLVVVFLCSAAVGSCVNAINAPKEAAEKAERDAQEQKQKAADDAAEQKREKEEQEAQDKEDSADAARMEVPVSVYKRAKDNTGDALAACHDQIISSATYGARGDNSGTTSWVTDKDGMMTIYGHDMLVKNAFNAEAKTNYICMYNPDNKAAVITSLD